MGSLNALDVGNKRVQFQEPGLRSSRTGFFSDTSEGTVADRDTTDAETDWTDWEAPQPTGTGAGRKAGLFSFAPAAEQRVSSVTGRVTRATAVISGGTRAKRSVRNGRVSPPGALDGGPNKRRKDDSEFSEAESGPRFACPYFKRDPQKYKTHRTCPGPGWPTVHRVKEHLYRRHSMPSYCPRCYTVFPKEASLTAHARLNSCTAAAGQYPEGITADQKERLKKRGLPNQSEDERWREMYRVIFPHDDEADLPSPFQDDHRSGSESLTFRQELLKRVRRELIASLNGKASDAEEKVMKRVAAIVSKCETELLQAESSSDLANAPHSMPSSEYWPSTADEESDAPCVGGFAGARPFDHYSHGADERSPTPAACEMPKHAIRSPDIVLAHWTDGDCDGTAKKLDDGHDVYLEDVMADHFVEGANDWLQEVDFDQWILSEHPALEEDGS